MRFNQALASYRKKGERTKMRSTRLTRACRGTILTPQPNKDRQGLGKESWEKKKNQSRIDKGLIPTQNRRGVLRAKERQNAAQKEDCS